jgi:hypothetical protein
VQSPSVDRFESGTSTEPAARVRATGRDSCAGPRPPGVTSLCAESASGPPSSTRCVSPLARRGDIAGPSIPRGRHDRTEAPAVGNRARPQFGTVHAQMVVESATRHAAESVERHSGKRISGVRARSASSKSAYIEPGRNRAANRGSAWRRPASLRCRTMSPAAPQSADARRLRGVEAQGGGRQLVPSCEQAKRDRVGRLRTGGRSRPTSDRCWNVAGLDRW